MYARRVTLIIGSALLLGLACPAMAQNQDQSATSQTSTSTTSTTTHHKKSGKTSKDDAFLREAAAGNLAEIKMGHLALDKSTSADVKQFGQRLVDDHTKANDQLMTLAQQKQVTLPTEPMKSEQKKATHLESLSGAAFDKAWTEDMVKDHKKDVAKYAKESTQAKDADVRQYASATLPVLKTHLQMAEQIKKSDAKGGMSHGSMNPASSSSMGH
jgi:putative membrane protein